MATSYNTPYKKLQRRAKRAGRWGYFLWAGYNGTYRKAVDGPIGTPRILGRRRFANAQA